MLSFLIVRKIKTDPQALCPHSSPTLRRHPLVTEQGELPSRLFLGLSSCISNFSCLLWQRQPKKECIWLLVWGDTGLHNRASKAECEAAVPLSCPVSRQRGLSACAHPLSFLPSVRPQVYRIQLLSKVSFLSSMICTMAISIPDFNCSLWALIIIFQLYFQN